MKPTLSRKLLGYIWELRGKKVAIIDINDNTEIVLDKVRVMSLMKFLPNCLDKMRIEEGKLLRNRAKLLRAKLRISKNLIRWEKNKYKKYKGQQKLAAKARKVK